MGCFLVIVRNGNDHSELGNGKFFISHFTDCKHRPINLLYTNGDL